MLNPFFAGRENRQSQAIQHHVIGLTGDRRHRERLGTGPHRGPRRKRGEAAVDARRVAERVEEIGVPDEGEVGLARALHPLDDLEDCRVMFVDLDHPTVDATEGVASIGQHADGVWYPTPRSRGVETAPIVAGTDGDRFGGQAGRVSVRQGVGGRTTGDGQLADRGSRRERGLQLSRVDRGVDPTGPVVDVALDADEGGHVLLGI